MDTISIHEKERLKKFGELEQLDKFNALRELGYEFKPIESDTIHHFEMAFLIFLVTTFSICLLSSVFAVIWGCYKFLIDLYPDERQYSSRCVEYILVRTATACFLMSPIVLFGATVFLLYTHLHDTICPILQLEIQNQNMEDYVNLFHGYFDSNHLISFFNDLLEERIPLNIETCTKFMRPMQGLWLNLTITSLFSLPWAFLNTRLAKTLRHHNKSVFYSSETYSTIPEKSKPPSIHSLFMPKY
uniref:Uncharacterized protein n=1 Tax=Acrobeloides nanus TaxID=290746 RepID=A0A914CQ44_9BILA